MRRLESDETWSLFDPKQVPDLSGLYSKAFEAAYVEYERRGFAVTAIRARALWETISDAIRETGTPFISYSDNVNGALSIRTYPQSISFRFTQLETIKCILVS